MHRVHINIFRKGNYDENVKRYAYLKNKTRKKTEAELNNDGGGSGKRGMEII